jgi:hypothetical protein
MLDEPTSKYGWSRYTNYVGCYEPRKGGRIREQSSSIAQGDVRRSQAKLHSQDHRKTALIGHSQALCGILNCAILCATSYGFKRIYK